MSDEITPDGRQPCSCTAYDAQHNDHTESEHTGCRTADPCGGCDDCLSSLAHYYRRLRETDGRSEP